jgi:hypothetical protein
MTQGLLKFKYEEEKKEKGLTSLAGLLIFVELFKCLKFDDLVSRHLKIKEDKQGWEDKDFVMALVLLNIAGGSCVSDIDQLEKDEGFCRILEMIELRGKMGRGRAQILKRWRKKSGNTVPSESSIFRYLSNFHNKEAETNRQEGKAFIPAANENLLKLSFINQEILELVQKKNPKDRVTLDIDATIVATNKKTALYTYKGGKGYQPLNVWLSEHEMILHTEFRDGNVPAGFEIKRVLEESLVLLPQGVKEVFLRSDSAAYQHELLKYCDSEEHGRFGRIHFAIGCDITESLKKSILKDKELVWKPLYRLGKEGQKESFQEWAEVCYVPNAVCCRKHGLEYRYLAIREELKERPLAGMEELIQLPFPTLEMGAKRYKLTGVVTNLKNEGEDIIQWYRKRAGKSEEAHSIMKEDLAGGQFPSNDFGENAAWWWMMILALNLTNIMKQHVFEKSWISKRMKAIRFNIINIAGRVIRKGKEIIVKLANGHASFKLFLMARQKIMDLECLSTG